MSAAHTPIHTLLVVGAGAGDDLATWRALKPRRLVLVEPNSDLTRVLAKKIRAQADEELIAKVCLAKDANTAELQVLSMAPESGLYAPAKALREFWPNIAVTKTVQAEAEPITRLVSGLGLNPEENNALILDTPGAEAELLQALLAGPESKVFSTIRVRTAAKPLYESNAYQETVEAVLRAAFYDLKQAQESDVSPHVSLSFTLDTRAVLIAERDSKIAALEQQMQEQAQVKEREKLNLAAQVTQLAGQLEGVRAELEQSKLANQELESAKAQLAQAKDQEIAGLRNEITELSTVRGSLIKEKSELTAARDTLAKEKADLIAARDSLVKEKADLAAERGSLTKEKSELSAKLAQHQKQLEDQTAKTKALESTNQQLQSTNQELTARQALLNEEIAKAEGQIELIKDLILRDEARV